MQTRKMNNVGNYLNRMDEVPNFGTGSPATLDYQENQQRQDPWPASEAWFCLRTLPKHEHMAAAQLRQGADIEVYLPRIRFKRATRCGPAWVTEALFQNYLFAKFDLLVSGRRVQAARGVRGIVHFGNRWPTIPEAAIKELQAAMDGQDLRVVEDGLQPGDRVQIAAGAMHGLEAVVSRVVPSQLRVAVLLDFLGRQTTVELDRNQLLVAAAEGSRRAWISAAGASSRTAVASQT